MRPSIEQVSREHDFTFRLKKMSCQTCQFDWHYHFEFEIMLMRGCDGQLFAGNFIGSTGPNTLAMFGPRLAHTFMEQSAYTQRTDAFVFWFSQSWINQLLETLPDLAPIKALLARANHGLLFSAELADQVFKQIEHFDDLSLMQQSHRFIQVLITLAEVSSPIKLNKTGLSTLSDDAGEKNKVVKVIDFVEQYFHQPVTIEQLAQHLHMSKSSVQRLFSRHFTETFSEHLKQFRVGKACEQLIYSKKSIATIAEHSGFGNLSNFNRQFKYCKSLTPREFRERYHQ